MNRTSAYWGPVFLYAGLIFYLSSLPGVPLPAGLGGETWEQVDPNKLILHIIEYSILGVLLLRAIINSHTATYAERALAMAVILGFSYGVSDEIHQYFVPNRTASFLDLFADGIGTYLGAYIRRDFWPVSRILR